MAASQRAAHRSDLLRAGAPSLRRDDLSGHALAARFEAGPVRRQHLQSLVEAAARTVPILTTLATVEGLHDHDPRSFWGLRRCGGDPSQPPPGVTAILLLSRAGLEHLLAGTLDYGTPQREALVDRRSAPFAIYIWMMFAPGIISGALFALFEHMNRQPYADADIYWRPVTAAGARLTRPFGFELASADGRPETLYRLARRPLETSAHTA